VSRCAASILSRPASSTVVNAAGDSCAGQVRVIAEEFFPQAFACWKRGTAARSMRVACRPHCPLQPSSRGHCCPRSREGAGGGFAAARLIFLRLDERTICRMVNPFAPRGPAPLSIQFAAGFQLLNHQRRLNREPRAKRQGHTGKRSLPTAQLIENEQNGGRRHVAVVPQDRVRLDQRFVG
jgi:hypothetical protein